MASHLRLATTQSPRPTTMIANAMFAAMAVTGFSSPLWLEGVAMHSGLILAGAATGALLTRTWCHSRNRRLIKDATSNAERDRKQAIATASVNPLGTPRDPASPTASLPSLGSSMNVINHGTVAGLAGLVVTSRCVRRRAGGIRMERSTNR